MRESLYFKYGKEYHDKISKMLSGIKEIEEEIKNIKTDYNDYPNKLYEVIIKFKYLREIQRYSQLNDGSAGNDIFIINYLLHDLLVYIYIVKEKDLSEEEQDTCALEIEIRFYFFLNCIYNLKEKFEKFLNFNQDKKSCKKSHLDSVLNEQGQRKTSELFRESYKKIKKYCDARGLIVHDIYKLNYDVLKNHIYICNSTFNLSKDNLNNKKNKRYDFNLKDMQLISLVEELQRLRKKTIEILLDIKNNIDLEELKTKFNNGKGGFRIAG